MIINNHDNLRMRLPTIQQTASASSSITLASSPPISGPWGPFELQNAGSTYHQAIFERPHNQIGQEADGWSDASGYTTSSPPTYDSEGDSALAALTPSTLTSGPDAATTSHVSTSPPQPHTSSQWFATTVSLTIHRRTMSLTAPSPTATPTKPTSSPYQTTIIAAMGGIHPRQQRQGAPSDSSTRG